MEQLDATAEAREEELGRGLDREWARLLMRDAAEHHARTALARGAAARRGVEVLRLRFQEGLAIRDIAARWNEDPAAVHRRYREAREGVSAVVAADRGVPQPGERRLGPRVRTAPGASGRRLKKPRMSGRNLRAR